MILKQKTPYVRERIPELLLVTAEKISDKELAVTFANNVESLVNAGVPLPDVFKMLEQTFPVIRKRSGILRTLEHWVYFSEFAIPYYRWLNIQLVFERAAQEPVNTHRYFDF